MHLYFVLSFYLKISEDPWVALHHNFLTESELENANAEIENFEFDEECFVDTNVKVVQLREILFLEFIYL